MSEKALMRAALEEEAAEARALAQLLTDRPSIENLLEYAAALESPLPADEAFLVCERRAA